MYVQGVPLSIYRNPIAVKGCGLQCQEPLECRQHRDLNKLSRLRS